MPGNYSRVTFDPRKHYRGVRMQQGRVQLDADWNEQVDILDHAILTRTRDLVGAHGAPAESAGFALEAACVLELTGQGELVTAGPSRAFSFADGAPFTVAITIQPATGPSTVVSAIDRLGRVRWALALDAGRTPVFQRAGAEVRAGAPVDWDGPRRIAVVYDGSELRLYVDGELAGRARDEHARHRHRHHRAHEALAAVLEDRFAATELRLVDERRDEPASREAVVLCLGAGAANGFFRGTLGDLRIHGQAVPPDQRGAPATLDTSDPSLVGAWPLDDGVGRVARELSPAHRDARLWAVDGLEPPRWRRAGIFLGPGRYYVDGVTCENGERIALTAQPFPPDGGDPAEPGLWVAALHVRDRVVTADQDPSLREVALGGPDTTVRTQTAWRVEWMRAGDDPQAPDPGDGAPAWRRFAARREALGTLAARRDPSAATELPGNVLYRVEIHDGGEIAGTDFDPDCPWPQLRADTIAGKPTALAIVGGALEPDIWTPGRWVEVVGSRDRLCTRLVSADADRGEVMLAEPVPRDAAPVLVRAVASFKWARDNASFAVGLRSGSGGTVQLRPRAGGDDGLLRTGDWVELVDDRSVFSTPGPLHRIVDVSDDHAEVTLDPPISPEQIDTARIPLLRRWDRDGAADAAVFPARRGWSALEHGVEVSFAGTAGSSPGQHWHIPARVRLGTVEWPQDGASPRYLAALGRRRVCRLALLRLDADGAVVEDLRAVFDPLGGRPGADLNGPVVVRGSLRVCGETVIDGPLRARRLDGELAPGSIGTPELCDAAVTSRALAPRSVHPRHLAPELGLVPVGFSILGDGPVPPPGFRYTRRQVEVANPAPHWRRRATLPGRAERLALVTVGEAVFALGDDGRIWRHDESAGGWEPAGALRPARRGFSAAARGTAIHVLGGRDQRGLTSAQHDVFDTITGRWHSARPMRRARALAAAAVVDDRLYALGGESGWIGWRPRDALVRLGSSPRFFPGRSTTASVEVYDPASDRWRRARPLASARRELGAAALFGRLHVVGGIRRTLFGRERTLHDHEAYIPLLDRWERRMPLPRPRGAHGLAAIEGRLYAVGGLSEASPLLSVESYTSFGDTWQPGEDLPEPRYRHGTAPLYGSLFVAGGTADEFASEDVLSCAVASTLFVHQKLDTDEGASAHPGHGSGHASPANASPDPRPATGEPIAADGEAPGGDAPSSPPAATPAADQTPPAADQAPPGGAPTAGASAPAGHADIKIPKIEVPAGPVKRLLKIAAAAVLLAVPVGFALSLGSSCVAEIRAIWDRITAPDPDAGVADAGIPDAMPIPDNCLDERYAEDVVDLGHHGPDDVLGLDLSHHDGMIAWRRVRTAGVAFGFAKVSEGATFTDPAYPRHYAAMGRCGILRGGYHFFVPETDPERQARNFLAALGDRRGELPPVIDVERAFKNEAKDCDAMIEGIRRFSDVVVQDMGRRPIIYSSKQFWDDQLCNRSDFTEHPLWIKRYAATPRELFGGWTEWAFWQYTASGHVGTDAKIDVNMWRGTLKELEDFAATFR